MYKKLLLIIFIFFYSYLNVLGITSNLKNEYIKYRNSLNSGITSIFVNIIENKFSSLNKTDPNYKNILKRVVEISQTIQNILTSTNSVLYNVLGYIKVRGEILLSGDTSVNIGTNINIQGLYKRGNLGNYSLSLVKKIIKEKYGYEIPNGFNNYWLSSNNSVVVYFNGKNNRLTKEELISGKVTRVDNPKKISRNLPILKVGKGQVKIEVPVKQNQIITVSPGDNIQAKLDNLRPGDTLQFHKGIYTGRYTIKNSGTKNAWIKITNFPGEKPVFKPKSNNDIGPIFYCGERNLSYFQINGLSFENPNGGGIQFYHTTGNYIIISNNEVVGVGYNGVNAHDMHAIIFQTNSSNPKSHNILMYGNYIHDNYTRHARGKSSGGGDNEAFTILGNVENFTMESNRIVNNSFIGLDIIGHRKGKYAWAGMNNKGLIVNNYIAGNGKLYKYSNGLYIDGAEDLLIEKNTSINNTTGITIAQEGEGAIGKNIIARLNYIENSILHDVGVGGNNYDSTIVHDVTFTDNIVKETKIPDESMLILMSGYNNKFVNNLFIGGERNPIRYDRFKYDKKGTWSLINNKFTSSSVLRKVEEKFGRKSGNTVGNNPDLIKKVGADLSRIPKGSNGGYIGASAHLSNYVYGDKPIILTVYNNYGFQVNNSGLKLSN